MEMGLQKDLGYEIRRLLLRRIKDYYQEQPKKIIPDNETDIDLLNMFCNDKEAAFDYGYIPIFEEDSMSQVFYNYKTGESFVAIKTDYDEYACFPETYSIINSFSSNIALNLGLCYKIFTAEKAKIEDEDLSASLDREVFKIEQAVEKQKKLSR